MNTTPNIAPTPHEKQMKALRPSEVTLYDADFSSVRFDRTPNIRDRMKDDGEDLRGSYVYGPRFESSEVSGPTRLCGLVSTADEKWFIFYVSDCYWPPLYVINGRSFEDAYEEFLEECVHLVKIEEDDLKDYNCGEADDPSKLTCGFNCNGVPCDTESVQGFEVFVVEARR